MTIKEALAFGGKQLKKIDPVSPKHHGAGSALLDASILLCKAIGKSKEFIYTYPEKKLSPTQEKKYKALISRRAKHEPLAYISGKKEFYGFEFLVNPSVLIPRPDTETLINAVLETAENQKPAGLKIIDVGTGSGAIAITLAKLLPKAQVFASDISPRSLALAKKNAKRLKTKVLFKKGNLLKPFSKFYSRGNFSLIITANLPYLSRAEWKETKPEVKKYEPKSALIGGQNGWEIYEKLFKEVTKISVPAHLFIEIGYNQKAPIIKVLNKILRPKKIETFKDIAGKWRTIHAVLGEKND